jgi:hypothetical protein
MVRITLKMRITAAFRQVFHQLGTVIIASGCGQRDGTAHLLSRSSTIISHHIAMLHGEAASLRSRSFAAVRLSRTDVPDDSHPPMPRRSPEDLVLGAIKVDLEFLIERTERFRKEQALKPLYTMIRSAAIVIAWTAAINR